MLAVSLADCPGCPDRSPACTLACPASRPAGQPASHGRRARQALGGEHWRTTAGIGSSRAPPRALRVGAPRARPARGPSHGAAPAVGWPGTAREAVCQRPERPGRCPWGTRPAGPAPASPTTRAAMTATVPWATRSRGASQGAEHEEGLAPKVGRLGSMSFGMRVRHGAPRVHA